MKNIKITAVSELVYVPILLIIDVNLNFSTIMDLDKIPNFI